jgi:hypothetical protein
MPMPNTKLEYKHPNRLLKCECWITNGSRPESTNKLNHRFQSSYWLMHAQRLPSPCICASRPCWWNRSRGRLRRAHTLGPGGRALALLDPGRQDSRCHSLPYAMEWRGTGWAEERFGRVDWLRRWPELPRPAVATGVGMRNQDCCSFSEPDPFRKCLKTTCPARWNNRCKLLGSMLITKKLLSTQPWDAQIGLLVML